MRKLSLLSFLAVATLAQAQYPGAKPVPEDVAKGFNAITIANSKTWLEYLAGPECMGRGTLQPGYKKAAEYMAARFKEMGLKPGGDNGTYFQDVPFGSSKVLDDTFVSVAGVKVAVGEDKLSISGAVKDVNVSKPIAIVYASGPEATLGDPAKLKDRIVFAQLSSVSREFRNQLRTAGAAAIIEVSDLITNRRESRFSGAQAPKSITARIHPEEFAKITKELGMNGQADGVRLLPEGQTGTMNVKVEANVQYEWNVVAILEGSDPVLKNEYVGVGSHLDHLGVVKRGDQEIVYWGADDDGSGSAAILGVAKGLSSNPLKPKRSVVFMAFCAEEMGLIGAGYFAENPPFPLDKMICELQMDMVGRNAEGPQNGNPNEVEVASENIDTIRLVGSKRISTALHELILEQNEFVNFRFKYDREDVYERSDHYMFAVRGVPVAFLFDGFHPDYHQPTDTVDKINFEKLTNTSKLYYLTALRAANRDKPFEKDVKGDD